MKHKVIIRKFDSGLNELLNAQDKRWNYRTKKLIVSNSEKAKNDRVCRSAISEFMKGVKIDNPIQVHYHIFVKDARHDRGNVYAALEKSFLDALQQMKVIRNDGFYDVLDSTFTTEIDKKNPRIEVTITEVEK